MQPTESTTTDAAAPERGAAVELADIATALRAADRVIVATHENPDGDAIGSARAMELLLQELGTDVTVYVPRGVVPREYEFIRPDRLIGELPADLEQQTLLCVDCGNASRLADETAVERATQVLNIDHHADNTHFGQLNVVRGKASCTTQLIFDLAAELKLGVSAQTATAIYVGLVTDTGRFQYSNTTSDAFRLAATLVDLGVDVHEVFTHVYESFEYPRLKLLGRGLENADRHDAGVISTYLTRDDFAEAGADDDSSEGIVDFLRGVEGTAVAVMVRELGPDGRAARKGSLRTTREDVDVSTIARTWNGGGHRQAAGFSTDDSIEQIVERVIEHVQQQRSAGS